ncbi:hypothetical protein MM236_16720 [Belliella sp. DSM 107340]|uniref:Uncharacterized protein n=1 Tax=Belliella calami TaxID=2923436 RepID=A0ABS9UT12_9BACT|nr:hypothetical protein [Belliella calami]MCH7399643.1 hypothetical protein [Belliella calami]
MRTIEKIDKENIPSLKFNKNEVLSSQEDIKKRWNNLFRAQALGNLLQSKVQITFETADQKIFQVNTTIWAVGLEFVTLKGGIHIPVNAILEVD